MEGLRPDHWHAIAKYLSVIDLCHMMQLSQSSFYLWVADRAWAHQRQRICARFPALNAIFDLYCEQGASGQHTSKRAEKSNANKKRKTAWITPRKGIWYVFKRWLILGTTMKGIKSLCKREEMHPIVISVVCSIIPCNELITKTKIKKIEHDGVAKGVYTTHQVIIRWGKSRYQCDVRNTRNFFDGHCFYDDINNEWFHESDLFEWGISKELLGWKTFLFQVTTRYDKHWNDLFENLIKNGGK